MKHSYYFLNSSISCETLTTHVRAQLLRERVCVTANEERGKERQNWFVFVCVSPQCMGRCAHLQWFC